MDTNKLGRWRPNLIRKRKSLLDTKKLGRWRPNLITGKESLLGGWVCNINTRLTFASKSDTSLDDRFCFFINAQFWLHWRRFNLTFARICFLQAFQRAYPESPATLGSSPVTSSVSFETWFTTPSITGISGKQPLLVHFQVGIIT